MVLYKMVKTGILLRRFTGLVSLPLVLLTGAGCTMPGAPQTLDEEQLGAISERVTQSQPGMEAALRADTKSCEGLCQHMSLDLSPRKANYKAVDLGLAIYETDLALTAENITAIEYCFDWRHWTQEEVQYLDARLGEVRGLGYGGVLRNAAEQRPTYNCYSFASISGREQLATFLRVQGAIAD
ncbi:hypothetical protein [Arthrobacter sp. BF1]|uniref:hypothetical protein n=1 Tax=Arthrobacter sp. BF1 TaxID=2821145 RepID=UPI001C4F2F89|nr:hypothetical protein [Arthrobacter sp. BF1]